MQGPLKTELLGYGNNWIDVADRGDVFLYDSINIEGVEMINPTTGELTGFLAPFVALGSAPSDTPGAVRVRLSANIITAGMYRNASASPKAGAVVHIGNPFPPHPIREGREYSKEFKADIMRDLRSMCP